MWRPNPLDSFKLSREEAYSELARRYFDWTGPATLGWFPWFAGLGVKASKEAVKPLGLETLDNRMLITPAAKNAGVWFSYVRVREIQ